MFEEDNYELVILDIMMPGKSGYDVCKEIRRRNEDVCIIVLTAKGEEIDKVVGLQLGADDYMTKPYGVHELLARISDVLRRSMRSKKLGFTEEKTPDSFLFGSARIDTIQYRAKKEKCIVNLSDRELQLLKYFYLHPNEVLSRDRLLNNIWGVDYFGKTRTMDQHIAQLRKKIEPDPGCPTVITTIHGMGYLYESS
jgi:DNA-binding response OmpR family regulator